ncbi:SDR family oxidoreductase [Deinococcus oregonensis]|uniref:dTDP-4-dehydrorhamnose reductase n=1 Tax=Deinococcus oregonensis TaxID=1805970 RepID=A0ABV6B6H9_9DEIO
MVKILMTGGGGRLGTELQALLPQMIAPSSQVLNVTDAVQVQRVMEQERPQIVVHAAAYTNVGAAEQERAQCWRVNVEGTRHVAEAVRTVGAKLIHISTDYVFSGDIGGYREEDVPGPVVNYYSLTKLVAEEAARSAGNVLIVRTSFRPRTFQYPVAFGDVFTSQDYVDIIAPMVAEVILNAGAISDPILHVATERKSVFELAQRRNAEVKEGSRVQASVVLPADVSLNTERWQALRANWVHQA